MDTHNVLVKMVLDRWNASVKNYNELLHSISDEQLEREIAPGRNRGVYLLGHLIAVHDDMLPLLNVGEKKYAELNAMFINAADKTKGETPSAKELRRIWHEQNAYLNQAFERLTSDEWFEKHTVVSQEDFASEPHRNKLNILLTRTTHLTYHTGQMVLIKQTN